MSRNVHHEAGSAAELVNSLVADGDDGKFMLGWLVAQWAAADAIMRESDRTPPEGVVLIVPTGDGLGAIGMADDPDVTLAAIYDALCATLLHRGATLDLAHKLLDTAWGRAPGMGRVGRRPQRRPRGRRSR